MAQITVPLTPSAPGNFTVAHGLGSTPAVIPTIVMTSGGSIWFQQPTAYDATNLYLVASAGGLTADAIVTDSGGGGLGNFGRYDNTVRNAIGEAIVGASIAVLTEPAMVSTQPGSPLQSIFAAPTSNTESASMASWLAGTATLTLGIIPSDLVVGSYINIEGILPTGYNGIAQVTAVSGLEVSYEVSVNPGIYISGGTVQTSVLPNPFLSDNLGNFFFYAAPGEYTIQIYGVGLQEQLVLADQNVSVGGGAGSVVTFSAQVPSWQTATVTNPTTNPDLNITDNAQAPNLVFAGPTTGNNAAPTFRGLVSADLPGGVGLGSVTLFSSNNAALGNNQTLFSTSVANNSTTPDQGFTVSNANANTLLAGPTSAGPSLPSYRALVPADLPFPAKPTVGVCFLGPTNGNNSVSAPAWRAPYNCTVTNVRGFMVGGNNCSINAQKDGGNLVSSLAIPSGNAGVWQDAGAITGNANVVAGNTITPILVSQNGNTASVTIQIDFTRP
jgi:hypothetical protein